MNKENGNIILFLAVVIAILCIIAYGMYLQSGGHGDIFQTFFHKLGTVCTDMGNVRDAAGNCVSK